MKGSTAFWVVAPFFVIECESLAQLIRNSSATHTFEMTIPQNELAHL